MASIVKAALHKLSGKSSLIVRSVCPVCPDHHEGHDDHMTMTPMITIMILNMTTMTTMMLKATMMTILTMMNLVTMLTKICIFGQIGPNNVLSDPFGAMPDQKIMRTRCLCVFFLPPKIIWIYGPKQPILPHNMLSWAHRPCRLI